jgi:GT2 family glycosyltransferase
MHVVTLNWNLGQDTVACIQSVLAAGVPAASIVIVDNGSTDDSAQVIAAHLPEVILVRNPTNLGFAGGMNAGIKAALDRGAESVLILNNDTVIDKTMVETLVEAQTALKANVIGPAIYYYDTPERIWKLGDVCSPWLPMPRPVTQQSSAFAAGKPFQVDYVTGCGMWASRQVFEQVGLFDESYFMYYEDADFCRRVRQAGFSIWCVPRARMWHKVSVSARKDKPTNRYHWAMNQVRFYHRHPHGRIGALREIYLVAKLLSTAARDLWRRDFFLIGPLWRGAWQGYQSDRRPGLPGARMGKEGNERSDQVA